VTSERYTINVRRSSNIISSTW